jgi:hypothetical protein
VQLNLLRDNAYLTCMHSHTVLFPSSTSEMSSFAQPAIPPPPAPLAGTFAGSDFDGLESASQTPPYDEATDVLIRMGDLSHPILDEAIARGDGERVIEELTRIRSQYPQYTLGLKTAVSYAIHRGQVKIVYNIRC